MSLFNNVGYALQGIFNGVGVAFMASAAMHYTNVSPEYNSVAAVSVVAASTAMHLLPSVRRRLGLTLEPVNPSR